MFAMQRIRGQLRASHRSRAPRPAAAGAAAIAGALPLVLLAACGAPICPMFPADNVWNTDISKLPVIPRSAAWLKSMNSARTFLHPDFGPNQGARLPDRLKPRRGHLHPRLLHRISNLRRAS